MLYQNLQTHFQLSTSKAGDTPGDFIRRSRRI